MADYPSTYTSVPLDIAAGEFVLHTHVSPAWEEIISIERVLLGNDGASIVLKPAANSATPLTIAGVSGQTANVVRVRETTSGSDLLAVTPVGQLRLPTQGSTGGIVLGTDVSIYRGSGAVLETAQKLSLSTQGTGGGIVFAGSETALYRPGSETTLETNTLLSTLITGATGPAYQAKVSGETYPRFSVRADGKVSWGTGATNNPDVSLYRSGTANLATDGALDVAGNFTAGGTIKSGSTAVVLTTDVRLSDSRTPTGPAGGDLTGGYPNPTLAAVGTAGTYSVVTTDSKGRVTSGSNPTYIAGATAPITRLSLSTGPSGPTGSVILSVDLASGVANPGTYKSVAVDTYGRVTSGSNPETLAGYGIIDAVNSSTVIVGSVTGPSNRLTYSVSGPTNSRAVTLDLQSGIATTGTYNSVTVDTYGRITSGSNATYVTTVTGPNTRVSVSTISTGPTGAGVVSIDLPTGVATAGAYNSVSVDTYGRVTSGSNSTFVASVTGPSSSFTFSTGSSGPTGSVLVTIDLAPTGTAGSYTRVTTDNKGRVVSGTNPAYVADVINSNGSLSVTSSPSGPTGSAVKTVNLPSVVAPGTYSIVVVDEYGRVTSGSETSPTEAMLISSLASFYR